MLATATLATGTGLAQGAASARAGAGADAAPAFADVPPCHWAAAAVARVERAGIFVGFPPDPSYLSVNALRQVFEGLKCGDPSWTLRFLAGAPAALRLAPGPALASFELEPRIVSLSKADARLAFRLTAVIRQHGTTETLERQGTVMATRTHAGWQIAYAGLAKLGLPFFPR